MSELKITDTTNLLCGFSRHFLFLLVYVWVYLLVYKPAVAYLRVYRMIVSLR